MLICRIFGHDRVSYESEYWNRRSWRWIPTRAYKCSRCHYHFGYLEYDFGYLEYLAFRIKGFWHWCLEECDRMDDFSYGVDDESIPF